MDFVQGLRAEHLQSFWFFFSSWCFALIGSFVSLLWVTAQDKEEAEFYKGKLEEYRWTLRLSSKGADFLERAISTLAMSTGVLVKAIPDRFSAEYAAAKIRNSPRPQASTTKAQPLANFPSQSQSALAQGDSESESYEEQTAGHTPDVGETPEHSTSGRHEDCVRDHLWYAAASKLNTIDAVYGLGRVGDGYDFQAFGGHQRAFGPRDV